VAEAIDRADETTGWRPIATFDPDIAWATGQKVLISGKYPNGVRWSEEGYFIGHAPGYHVGHWSGRKLDLPDLWMPFPEVSEPNAE
jgi:hypothetical protein